ncbi:MAG: MBL fold metallo-hydrolase [Candidatus Odinarchaeota archaeon]
MILKFTWLGTASYFLDINGTRLMFDPFFERNPRSTPALNTKRDDIKNIAAVFISHGHFDHITDAGWFAENLNIPVYCSETAKDNMIRWAEGELIEDHSFPITQKGKNNIKTCDYYDKIEITNNLIVELIKSEHIKFDANTILTRLFSWDFLKQARSMAKLGRSMPKGKVFGFCTCFNEKKIVSFGSLWHKYEDILNNYQNCDIFIAPIAGNSKKNLAKKGIKMVDILKPKIVIPIHWDNFYPPISRTEDISVFLKVVGKKHPNIEVIKPEIDREISINI